MARPIDADAMEQDLRRQFAAIYKSAMGTPIMQDDPFVELLAKSEGRHMKLYIDGLCEYIDSRPTLDVQPVRRGEWEDLTAVEFLRVVNQECGKHERLAKEGRFPCRDCPFDGSCIYGDDVDPRRSVAVVKKWMEENNEN